MNKNRILELLTDKKVKIYYNGKECERYSDEEHLFLEVGGLEDIIYWDNVDFTKFTFWREFDATI